MTKYLATKKQNTTKRELCGYFVGCSAWQILGKIPKEDSFQHYNDVIMGAMASQITSLIQAQIKESIKAPCHWPFMRGIHRSPVNSPHKGPVTRKMFLFWWCHREYECGKVHRISVLDAKVRGTLWIMMTSWHRRDFRITGSLWGESIGGFGNI